MKIVTARLSRNSLACLVIKLWANVSTIGFNYENFLHEEFSERRGSLALMTLRQNCMISKVLRNSLIALACLLMLLLSWSSISKALSSRRFRPPTIVDLASRDEVQRSKDKDFLLLLIFTGLVFAGVLMEGPELAVEIFDLFTRKSREHKNLLIPSIYRKEIKEHRALKVFATVGWLLILVGVCGEGVVEGVMSPKESAIKTFDDVLVKSALDRAEAVEKKADMLDSRLANANKQLDGIERDVLTQGPRWRILEQGKEEFIAKLRPFAQQKVVVMECGNWGGTPPEQFRLVQNMVNFFTLNEQTRQHGAGWNVSLDSWENCPSGGATSDGGNLIVTSMASSRKVVEAANALYEVLNKLQISTIKIQVRPREADPNSPMAQFFGLGSPWQKAAMDPNSVVILVGENPMYDLAGWNARKKKQRK
jgi:hypothetical protein